MNQRAVGQDREASPAVRDPGQMVDPDRQRTRDCGRVDPAGQITSAKSAALAAATDRGNMRF